MSRLAQEILAAGGASEAVEEGFTKEFTFQPDFIGFEGHFPDDPILPGVIQLMLGSLTVEEATGKPLTVNTVSKAKFLKPVSPNETLLVRTNVSDTSNEITAAITIHSGERIASSYVLKFAQEST